MEGIHLHATAPDAAARNAEQPHARRRPGSGSADGRRILDAAIGPKVVDPARNAQLGSGSDIALEHLVIVANELDDARRPILGQADLLAVISFGADQAF